jgi:TPR repeat protein
VNRGEASLSALTKAKQLDLGDVTRPRRQAADQGHYRAQFGLGFIFDHALGVEKNHSEATEMFRKTADHSASQSSRSSGC